MEIAKEEERKGTMDDALAEIPSQQPLAAAAAESAVGISGGNCECILDEL